MLLGGDAAAEELDEDGLSVAEVRERLARLEAEREMERERQRQGGVSAAPRGGATRLPHGGL